jgi:hypothetical protein
LASPATAVVPQATAAVSMKDERLNELKIARPYFDAFWCHFHVLILKNACRFLV